MNKGTVAGLIAGVVLARTLISRLLRFRLRGKIVVVTGGARGLGLVLARQLISRGARVALCSRHATEVQRARDELVSRGGTVFAATCDVTERDQLTHFLSQVEAALGPVDVLINNPGVIQVGPLELMNAQEYDAALRVHFWAPLHATFAVVPQMRRRHAGRIVNITSIAAKVPVPHLLPYSASKFAAYGFSTGLRAELARGGVKVTTVCPGPSMSVERAARQIIDACERGDAEVVLSMPARLLARVSSLAPSWVQNLFGLVDRLLPGPRGGSAQRVEGKDTQPRWLPGFLTRLTDTAWLRNHEVSELRASRPVRP